MFFKRLNLFFITILLLPTQLNAVTFVYNLRIAETTKREQNEQVHLKNSLAVVTPVFQNRTTYQGAHQDIYGTLCTLTYSRNNYYVRAAACLGSVRTHFNALRTEITQWDDILLYAGHTWEFGKRKKATISLLLGIPTHKDTSFQALGFGTGHVGIGVQADSAYHFRHNPNQSLVGAIRFVRFFPRMVTIPLLDPCKQFNFNIGNVVDILVGHHIRNGRQAFEFGYNPTFGFDATLDPDPTKLVEQINFMRSSIYGNYGFGFLIKGYVNLVSFGASYGLDHLPKVVGIRQGYTIWGTWGINF